MDGEGHMKWGLPDHARTSHIQTSYLGKNLFFLTLLMVMERFQSHHYRINVTHNLLSTNQQSDINKIWQF